MQFSLTLETGDQFSFRNLGQNLGDGRRMGRKKAR